MTHPPGQPSGPTGPGRTDTDPREARPVFPPGDAVAVVAAGVGPPSDPAERERWLDANADRPPRLDEVAADSQRLLVQARAIIDRALGALGELAVPPPVDHSAVAPVAAGGDPGGPPAPGVARGTGPGVIAPGGVR